MRNAVLMGGRHCSEIRNGGEERQVVGLGYSHQSIKLEVEVGLEECKLHHDLMFHLEPEN